MSNKKERKKEICVYSYWQTVGGNDDVTEWKYS